MIKFSYEYAIKECRLENEIYTIHIDYLLWGEVSNAENYKQSKRIFIPIYKKLKI